MRPFGPLLLLAVLAPAASSLAEQTVCSPLPADNDTLAASGLLVLDLLSGGEPFVVRLSSAGVGGADAIVHRNAQAGDTVATSITQLELSGFHPRTGTLHLRKSPTLLSTGEIREIVKDGACAFVHGESFFDVFIELDSGGSGETWHNLAPLRVDARQTRLPAVNERFESPVAGNVTLVDKVTGQPRALVFFQRLHLGPAFPPPGIDCFDVDFSAHVNLTAPGVATTLSGSGAAAIAHGAMLPRFCSVSELPCQSEANCPGTFNVCEPPGIETELLDLEVTGTHGSLGNWEIGVIPAAGDSNCCAEQTTPGCSDPECAEIVCAADPSCCTVQWDNLCADLAGADPICEPGCFNANAPHSKGEVQSVSTARTYPASSFASAFVLIETQFHGDFQSPGIDPVRVQSAGPLTNLPPDPGTEYPQTDASDPLVRPDQAAAGSVTDAGFFLRLPRDCEPPPPAGADCLDSTFEITLDLPACAVETLAFSGSLRLLRDAPQDPGGQGVEGIDALLSLGSFTATSPCAGPLTLRLSPTIASTGRIESLAVEEFHPASSFFDVFFELEGPGGTLHGGPLRITATWNAIPPDPGEILEGPDAPVDLLDSADAHVGDLLGFRAEIAAALPCPPSSLASIRLGPAKDDLAVAPSGAAAGVGYDVVRGELFFLHATQGGFITAQCLQTDGGPSLDDTELPDPDRAFYYVARGGFGAYDATWNSGGPAQQGDRDQKIFTPPCP